jgi:hypothetical protein
MRSEWNRDVVWSERDSRRRRRHSIAGAVIATTMTLGLVVANHACYELLFLSDAPREKPQLFVPVVSGECALDSDCVLMPAVFTCCGECEPAPPFSATPRSELADLRELCSSRERVCDPPICSPMPAGCEARAACRKGECVVVANDHCSER